MVRALVSSLLLAAALAGCGTAYGPTAARTDAFGARAKEAPVVSAENFTKVNADLYRMGVPTDADMAAIAKLGVKTDINLMSSFGEEAEMVKHETAVATKLGIEMVHLPLPFKTAIPDEMVQRFFAVFKDPKRLPAVIHCRHGRDRTGTMSAIYRIRIDGWTNAKAFAEMQSFGFKETKYPLFAAFVKGFDKPGAEGVFPVAQGFTDPSAGWNDAE